MLIPCPFEFQRDGVGATRAPSPHSKRRPLQVIPHNTESGIGKPLVEEKPAHEHVVERGECGSRFDAEPGDAASAPPKHNCHAQRHEGDVRGLDGSGRRANDEEKAQETLALKWLRSAPHEC
jgi:hypothetical protein